jgi:hypothetical protein
VFGKVLPEDINEYFAISLLLIRERSLGPASFFSPYIDVLPTAEEVSVADLSTRRGPPLSLDKDMTECGDRATLALIDHIVHALHVLRCDVWPVWARCGL